MAFTKAPNGARLIHTVPENSARVAQAPGSSSSAGTPRQWRHTRASFPLVTIPLDEQRKVTSCRAAPDITQRSCRNPNGLLSLPHWRELLRYPGRTSASH